MELWVYKKIILWFYLTFLKYQIKVQLMFVFNTFICTCKFRKQVTVVRFKSPVRRSVRLLVPIRGHLCLYSFHTEIPDFYEKLHLYLKIVYQHIKNLYEFLVIFFSCCKLYIAYFVNRYKFCNVKTVVLVHAVSLIYACHQIHLTYDCMTFITSLIKFKRFFNMKHIRFSSSDMTYKQVQLS